MARRAGLPGEKRSVGGRSERDARLRIGGPGGSGLTRLRLCLESRCGHWLSGKDVRRWEFSTFLGGAAAERPLAAHVQAGKVRGTPAR
jgi:hypothetical protein